jgi:phage baseplate assembly protein W
MAISTLKKSINLSFPLKKGSKGAFETNEDTLQAVADDLRILLITNYGERPIHFDFGANLRSVIFEFRGETLKQAIKDRILSAVAKWMPFVKIISIVIEDSRDSSTVKENAVKVTLEFTVGNLDITKILVQRIKA